MFIEPKYRSHKSMLIENSTLSFSRCCLILILGPNCILASSSSSVAQQDESLGCLPSESETSPFSIIVFNRTLLIQQKQQEAASTGKFYNVIMTTFSKINNNEKTNATTPSIYRTIRRRYLIIQRILRGKMIDYTR